MKTASFVDLINYSKLKLSMLNLTRIKSMSKLDDSEIESESNKQQNISRSNVLSNIDDLIIELESICEQITEQASEHINDNDVILTANHSDLLEQFFVAASKGKKFSVIIAESAPTLR